MSKAQNMGTGADPKASPTGGGGGEQDLSTLTNALRFERDKKQVLLNEVVVLEDELVNRQMTDFASVIERRAVFGNRE